ncbi:Fmp40p KNAG_0D00950 [Huiozyma naganishii CBS 8797]|uniref:Selenoprotein O n=1 Tax=Huiozyma naganishii (strain ATCC MYA-139 / BCRC 22969 / CBS 8797 / KCTC 17520 / NBRC 10181 / NCYC 3082 / Yp74L-3) TaxID=1071383 RepID=J7RXM6_HUIN7|nr:hypothetical protein KNAG_0D00950 [Kazachstania naganishii CBS 8797]CCK69847.1 hypothetical protein KNAG_0D00950 [Kazachstania naganishii CBS 8797]
MTERKTILQTIKLTGSSKILQKLTPDQKINSLRKAIDLYQQNNEKALKLFHTPHIVTKGSHFSYNIPERRANYKPLIVSEKALYDLNLLSDETGMKLFSGQEVYCSVEKNIFPYSLAYAGFQFGEFAGQLGDGRVVNLFQLQDRMDQTQTLQLKGSGMTPFSRFADGKAVLRSSIREFIISECLYHIGIPSTRSLQLTLLPGTKAMRSSLETCAVVCRFAPSWIRIGNFDLFRWKADLPGLVKLADYCIEDVFQNFMNSSNGVSLTVFGKDFFPDEDQQKNITPTIKQSDDNTPLIEDQSKYDQFFRHVVNLNAECVAHWQAYGFLNGVLNTDNTSILGLSIDFGPFNFLDKFQPDFTPNHDDYAKRYCFANQPGIMWWNLAQLAQALAILIGPGETFLQKVLEGGFEGLDKDMEGKIIRRANEIIRCCGNEYKFRFTTKYADIMAKRLGIDLNIDFKDCKDASSVERTAEVVREFCSTFVEPLLEILQRTQIDYNMFFVRLQNFTGSITSSDSVNSMKGLSTAYLELFFDEKQLAILKAQNSYPIDAAKEHLDDTLDLVIEWTEAYQALIPNPEEKIKISGKVNPLFTPRSWIFNQVIDDLVVRQKDLLDDPKAKLDTSLLRKLCLMSSNPYDASQWEPEVRPDLVEQWSSNSHHNPETTSQYMQQASCSS